MLLDEDDVKAWIRNHPTSRLIYWPENGISVKILNQYLVLLLNMGLIGKVGPIADNWTTKPSHKTPFFNQIMPVNLFLIVHRMLHLNDSKKEKKRGDGLCSMDQGHRTPQ